MTITPHEVTDDQLALDQATALNIIETGVRYGVEDIPSPRIVNMILDWLEAREVEFDRGLGSLNHRINELENQLVGSEAAAVALREERDSMSVANRALLADLEGHVDTIRDLTEKRAELQELNDTQRARLNGIHNSTGVETPDDVLRIQRDLSAATHSLDAMTLDRDSHRSAIVTINEKLLEEATRRDWCADFDVFCSEVNAILPAHIRIGKPEVMLRFHFSALMPENMAERIEGAIDRALRSEFELPACNGFEWELDS